LSTTVCGTARDHFTSTAAAVGTYFRINDVILLFVFAVCPSCPSPPSRGQAPVGTAALRRLYSAPSRTGLLMGVCLVACVLYLTDMTRSTLIHISGPVRRSWWKRSKSPKNHEPAKSPFFGAQQVCNVTKGRARALSSRGGTFSHCLPRSPRMFEGVSRD